jgi:hypothetical protein
VGGKTKIPYYQDFVSYKKLLESQRRKAPIRSLFRVWDTSLFQGVEHRPNVSDGSMDMDLKELQGLSDEYSDGESD